jgi:O-antigen ligase
MTRILEKILGLLLVAVIVAPLIYMPLNSAEPFKIPSETVIVALAWLFIATVEFVRAAMGESLTAGLVTSACRRWVLALAVWLGLNSLIGILPAAQFAYAGTLVTYILFGYAVFDWLDRSPVSRRRWVLGGLAFMLAFETVSSIMQMRHFDFVYWGQKLQPGGYFQGYMAVLGATAREGSPIGTLGNPNYLGEFLAIAWPVLVGWAVGIRRPGLKAATLAVLLVPMALLLLTSCRAAFLGLVICAPIAAALAFGLGSLDPRSWLKTRNGKIAVIGVCVLLVAGMGFAGGPLISKMRAGGVSELNFESRAINWHAATSIWRDHPLNGAGLGSFKVLDVAKLREAYPQGLPPSAASSRFYEAHNEPLQILAELGLVGMGIILLALYHWLQETRANSSVPVSAKFGMLWGVGALYFASCFGFPFHIPVTALAFTLVLPLGLARPEEEPVPAEGEMPLRPLMWGRAALVGVVLAGFAAVVIQYDVWPLFESYREQYEASSSADRGEFDLSKIMYRNALHDNRFKGTVVTQAMIELWRARDFQGMVNLYDENLKEGVGMDALTMKGDALTELGRKDEAIAAYTAVIHYYSPNHPNYLRASSQLGRLALMVKKS